MSRQPRNPLARTNLIPAVVRVGGRRISVKRDESPEAQGAIGYFQQTPAGASICVDSRLHDVQELATFMHELTHAIDETFGLGLHHRQVDGLGEGLAQALRPHFTLKALRTPRKSRKTSVGRRRTRRSAK